MFICVVWQITLHLRFNVCQFVCNYNIYNILSIKNALWRRHCLLWAFGDCCTCSGRLLVFECQEWRSNVVTGLSAVLSLHWLPSVTCLLPTSSCAVPLTGSMFSRFLDYIRKGDDDDESRNGNQQGGKGASTGTWRASSLLPTLTSPFLSLRQQRLRTPLHRRLLRRQKSDEFVKTTASSTLTWTTSTWSICVV